ncbi:alpha/beta fold hydrolase [Mycolicibacterium sp. CBMA 226]|uniref:alpha/beta fold hydrolase n=1 Tax=Mycolicibacterium sp. CBMA 226 TaxID=2606611 RepID=UPI0028BED206|nr:alpha/beta fold hydrolase [Mycolicibacterium sp. CBMA 226]
MSGKSGFRNVESRQRYLGVYDRLRALSPAPDAVHDVPTDFGVVRVYQHGSEGGIPVVLLHCFWATSAIWAEYVSALTSDFTVYTVDLLGQPGASVQSRSMKSGQDCACCLGQVLGGLGLAGVHLVGHSYGGWTAAQIAARIPDRLASVTLIEPVNTVARLSTRFWRTGALLLLPGAERKQRTVAAILGHPAPGSLLDSVMELVMAAGSAFASFGTPFPRYIPDSLLCSVEVPVQVLLAGNTIHDSERGLDRIRRVVPSWGYRLWPEATHMLPCEAVSDVVTCIRSFAHEHAAG